MKEENKPLATKAERSGDWKQFWGFLKKARFSWGWIALAFAITVAYYAVASYAPGNTAALYAGDFSMSAILALVANLAWMLGLSLVSSLSQLMAESKSVRSVRKTVWRRMMGVRTDYYNENDPNRLLSAVTIDTESTVYSVISVIITVPSIILYLFMCLGQLSMYSSKLLAVVFILVPVYIVYAILMGRWQYKAGRRIQMRIGGLTGFLAERIRNLPLIKSFATEKQEEQRGVEAAGELCKANVRYSYISGVMVAYIFVTEAVGTVVSVLWGSMLLRNGEIDLEAWLAFFLFVPMIDSVLRQLSMTWANLKEIQGRAARLGAIMDAPQEEMNETVTGAIPQGDVKLENVSLRYNEEAPVFSDLSFTIPQGKATAIVGASGSGKTTVLKLLEKLYTPNAGRITVGGQDIASLNLGSWRDSLSYVTQDANVFSGTVRECLTYGVHREVTQEELEQVTKLAGIYDYIVQQPDGFDAQLAIWGIAMSGGQRQRLVIARELLKDADVLLLDEPTSALDAETACEISDTIYERFAGKTIVTVTHELNFIAGADQIIVLNKGAMAGCGTHDELMEHCPVYRELVEEQSYQEVFAS